MQQIPQRKKMQPPDACYVSIYLSNIASIGDKIVRRSAALSCRHTASGSLYINAKYNGACRHCLAHTDK